ncbi:hypothetical protein J6590_028918 [Homalodisca vitripennis]|nr:hypothetical protein J6590_028918 [Homalodisca vitripennis]
MTIHTVSGVRGRQSAVGHGRDDFLVRDLAAAAGPLGFGSSTSPWSGSLKTRLKDRSSGRVNWDMTDLTCHVHIDWERHTDVQT